VGGASDDDVVHGGVVVLLCEDLESQFNVDCTYP